MHCLNYTSYLFKEGVDPIYQAYRNIVLKIKQVI